MLLLKQYQSFTGIETNKNECIYKFICDGNIDEYTFCKSSKIYGNKYKYNEILLLNDWYYTLIHYCNNNQLFETLYKYINREIGISDGCDINNYKFCSPQGQQYTSNHDTNDYYGFKDHKQQTRIRILNNIHCNILHSYDIGFKLTNLELDYVCNGDSEHNEYIDPMEKHLVDLKQKRLKRILIPKKKI